MKSRLLVISPMVLFVALLLPAATHAVDTTNFPPTLQISVRAEYTGGTWKYIIDPIMLQQIQFDVEFDVERLSSRPTVEGLQGFEVANPGIIVGPGRIDDIRLQHLAEGASGDIAIIEFDTADPPGSSIPFLRVFDGDGPGPLDGATLVDTELGGATIPVAEFIGGSVPEPSTLLLLGMGSAALASLGWRRRRRA